MAIYSNEIYLNTLRMAAKSDLPWEKLTGKKIFISGATGLFGLFLTDLLMYKNKEDALNCHVTAVSRNEEKARKKFNPAYFETDCFTYLAHDISVPFDTGDGQKASADIIDQDHVGHDGGKMIRGHDYVIHMASTTHPVAYAKRPIDTVTSNVFGTKNLLDYCSAHDGCRFVLLSSVEVYGENRGDVELFDEKYCGYLDSNTLRAGYPESKRLCETLCQAYISEKGVDAVIPRLPRSFGPTLDPEDSKALSQFIKKAVKGEDIVLKSEGNQHYSYLYAPDAVLGILRVMLLGECGQVYNLADESCDMTLKHLAGICAAQCGREVVFDLPDATERAGYSTATKARLDGTRARKELGFKPLYLIEDGLKDTIMIMRSESLNPMNQ